VRRIGHLARAAEGEHSADLEEIFTAKVGLSPSPLSRDGIAMERVVVEPGAYDWEGDAQLPKARAVNPATPNTRTKAPCEPMH
jgi:hypothetical protein